MAVDREELKHVYANLQEQGYYEAVFDFNFLTDDGKEPHTDPSRTNVIVTCTENNVQRTYDAADRTTWVQQFTDDVKNGVFGPAPRGVKRPYDIAPGRPSAG